MIYGWSILPIVRESSAVYKIVQCIISMLRYEMVKKYIYTLYVHRGNFTLWSFIKATHMFVRNLQGEAVDVES
jgi:hypothetical protein